MGITVGPLMTLLSGRLSLRSSPVKNASSGYQTLITFSDGILKA